MHALAYMAKIYAPCTLYGLRQKKRGVIRRYTMLEGGFLLAKKAAGRISRIVRNGLNSKICASIRRQKARCSGVMGVSFHGPGFSVEALRASVSVDLVAQYCCARTKEQG